MLVLIRGAGDIATGIALRLHRSGLQVVMTDLPRPTAIRRTVCFSPAITDGETTVEGVRAVYAPDTAAAKKYLSQGAVPVLADPELTCLHELHPDALVDAILAKRNLGTRMTDAPVVVGVGPGFTAGEDCHAVVETMRGHTLRAPADGVFTRLLDIGAEVKAGDIAGTVGGEPMRCTIGGVLRGILPSGTPVHKGMKSGDVDPRCQPGYCTTASDKALAVGGGVLEAILHLSGALDQI